MFDIGFVELLVVGVVALIVVGPKDLPAMFRTLGRFTARMRALGHEFTSAMNAAADQSGMKDVAKDLKSMTNPRSYGLDKLNEAADKFDNWTPGKTSDSSAKKPAADDPERAADVEKIRAATEAKGREKLERERAAAAEAAPSGSSKTKPTTATTAKPKAAKPKTAQPKPAKPKTAKPKPAKAKAATTKAAASGPDVRKPAAPRDPAETKTDDA